MKKLISRSAGFTLIELLVVIAIIGLLASVVLVSLGGSRDDAKDVSVKSTLNTIRTQANVWHSNNSFKYSTSGGVVGSCASVATNIFSDPTIVSSIASITSNAVAPTCGISANGQSFYIYTTLRGTGTKWCVDSKLSATTSIAAVATYTCI